MRLHRKSTILSKNNNKEANTDDSVRFLDLGVPHYCTCIFGFPICALHSGSDSLGVTKVGAARALPLAAEFLRILGLSSISMSIRFVSDIDSEAEGTLAGTQLI